MALNTIPLPFGMREIKLTPYTDATATALSATSVALPNSRTMSFTEKEDFEDLRGGDTVVASHGAGPGVDWELEGGGVSFEAVQVMYGGMISTTGVTPNQVKTYRKLITDSRPYFKTEGRAISDSGGDMHMVLWRCKATGDLSGEMSDGNWFLTGASGGAYGSLLSGSLNALWDWVQNETATAIV